MHADLKYDQHVRLQDLCLLQLHSRESCSASGQSHGIWGFGTLRARSVNDYIVGCIVQDVHVGTVLSCGCCFWGSSNTTSQSLGWECCRHAQDEHACLALVERGPNKFKDRSGAPCEKSIAAWSGRGCVVGRGFGQFLIIFWL